ncbi:uncharacterized protein LOC111500676 isoform X2 [Maylandia zebra]|uniref:uncharacterized protein LOC111500676 isoform X2 n=1 Tax=Maylandia zebra TaxID=106582 RepID=UPI00403C57BD
MVRRFQRLWKEEVAKRGPEKASLVRVALRFLRTRLIRSTAVSVFVALSLFLGPYLEFCDGILVLEDGEVQEAGNHQALMNANGRYAQLISNYQMEESKKQMEDEVMSLDPANLNESELRPGEDVGMMNNDHSFG